MNIQEILHDLGYNLNNHGNYYTCQAVYRNGVNPGSLVIYPNTNIVIDFVTGQKFSVEELIKLSLGLKDIKDAKEWLKTKNVTITAEEKEPQIQEPKIFPAEWVNHLDPNHEYWINRGISKEVLEELKGGIATDGIPRMKGRYVFPIFNSQNKLVGLAGRLVIDDKNKPKWKLLGEKKLWKYPLFANHKIINNKKQVVLVESIGNLLALWDAGCKNVIVMFGVDVSFEIINYLLKFNIRNIIISTDNDGGAGNQAAIKIKRKLCKYFDHYAVRIIHSCKKDFADQRLEDNIAWVKKYVISQI